MYEREIVKSALQLTGTTTGCNAVNCQRNDKKILPIVNFLIVKDMV